MATANAKPTVLPHSDATLRYEIVQGTIAIDASPATYAQNGLTVDFTGQEAIKSSQPPTRVKVWSMQPAASPTSTLYFYRFNPGTAMNNGKLQIFVQDGTLNDPLQEVGNGVAIPAGVSGDTIYFEAWFPKLT